MPVRADHEARALLMASLSWSPDPGSRQETRGIVTRGSPAFTPHRPKQLLQPVAVVEHIPQQQVS